MKKILLFTSFCLLYVANVHAQWATYTPVPRPSIRYDNSFNSVPITVSPPVQTSPVYSLPKLVNTVLEEVTGYNLSQDKEVVIKIKILIYDNESTELYVIGEKINNQWRAHDDLTVLLISNLLAACETDEEKEFFLGLSEHFSATAFDEKRQEYLVF